MSCRLHRVTRGQAQFTVFLRNTCGRHNAKWVVLPEPHLQTMQVRGGLVVGLRWNQCCTTDLWYQGIRAWAAGRSDLEFWPLWFITKGYKHLSAPGNALFSPATPPPHSGPAVGLATSFMTWFPPRSLWGCWYQILRRACSCALLSDEFPRFREENKNVDTTGVFSVAGTT